MSREFISLNAVETYFETTKKDIQNLSYLDKKNGRQDRFIFKDGLLYVHSNYKCPHFEEISELYYKALECGASEKDIARFVAKRVGKSEHCVYHYFRNFKFKNPDFARIVGKLLKIYIKQSSLFADEILAESKNG
ncbi:hypothetical protein [Campylobacter sp. RM16192]|uniref:hypothetical protein n=1 Tax=Campylobacter sp. RM16192 TaxID=1660080 RepID=UPI00145110F7|nr:hypothetical protein [Campylobacter sp. RM16192]QCD52488.1 hypothetical protein CDOMC_0865 [Campylobacter sp. RM16192]